MLSADLDWGLELRAEALVMGKIVGNSFRTPLMADKHLWFRDMAPGGSNALMATVESAGPAVAGQPTNHTVKMPTCYPYPNRVKYQVSWTGGAMPAPARAGGAARSPACSFEATQSKGTCTFDPKQEFVISLVWPTARQLVAVGGSGWGCSRPGLHPGAQADPVDRHRGTLTGRSAVSYTVLFLLAALGFPPSGVLAHAARNHPPGPAELVARRWKINTHLFAANQALADALNDGMVTIAPYGEFPVAAAALRALRAAPAAYRAGVLAPDLFPDMYVGGWFIHSDLSGTPERSMADDWMRHVWKRPGAGPTRASGTK